MINNRRSSIVLLISLASLFLVVLLCIRVSELQEEVHMLQNNYHDAPKRTLTRNIRVAEDPDKKLQPVGSRQNPSVSDTVSGPVAGDSNGPGRASGPRDDPPLSNAGQSPINEGPDDSPFDFDIEGAMRELLPDNFDNHCDHLFTRAGYKGFQFSDFYQENFPKYETKIASLGGKEALTPEGSSNIMRTETMMFHEVARWPFVKTACETGFNIGYSSFNYLSANPNLKVISFDLGRYNGSLIMAGHMRSLFGDRINVVWGDSTQSVPTFITTHPDVKCDFILADGGHTKEVATADVNNLIRMGRPGRSIIFYDDFPCPHLDIMDAWEDAIKDGRLKELFRCNPYSPRRGFAAAIVMKNV